MNLTEFRLSRDLLGDFDIRLQSFYHEVLTREMDLSKQKNVLAIRKALKEVVHAYKKDTVLSKASRILYDTPEKRLAYVLKHCPCFGSAVARHFLRLMMVKASSPRCGVRSAVRKRLVRLCCLGGGPGTEAVAVAKVIGALEASNFPVNGQERLHLRVNVVDLSGDWRSTTESVIATLNESRDLLDNGSMSTSVELLEADLTQPEWGPKVREAIGQADVITMVYFVSAVNGSGAQGACPSMLQRIVQRAKPECLLFFLDSSRPLHYKVVQSAATCDQYMRLDYGPFFQEFHTLSMASVRRFVELYFDRFRDILCLTNCFVTVAAWTKTETPAAIILPPPADRSGGLFAEISNRSRKVMRFNTRRQELFRQRVERLLLSELDMDFTLVLDDPTEQDALWDDSSTVDCSKTLNATKSKQKRIFTECSCSVEKKENRMFCRKRGFLYKS